MDKSCIFAFHLSTGDNFTIYAAVRHFQKIYKDVYIFCLHHNRNTIAQLYQPYENVHIIILDESHNHSYNHFLVPSQVIEQCKFLINNSVLLVSGCYEPNFDTIGAFWERFYDQLKLPYRMRYDYEDIHRNKERETNLYNSIVSKYGEKYIFLHDHRSIKFYHNFSRGDVRVESELPVFHPNINYYAGLETKCDLWSSEFSTDNLLDYCTLIENATEIHICDSAFSCLMPFLDLKNVKKKCIYTSLNGIIDYHDEYKNWEIVKR